MILDCSACGIEGVLKPVSDKEGYIDLTEIQNKTPDNIYMLFNASFIPESYTENPQGPVNIMVCDYASAGNGNEKSFYKVWSSQLINPTGN